MLRNLGRFFVRFENPETRFLEPTNPEIDDYAPEELPGRRPVLGYKPDGKLTTLREGKNQMVCLISDPAKPTFESACYHKISNPIWRGAAN